MIEILYKQRYSVSGGMHMRLSRMVVRSVLDARKIHTILDTVFEPRSSDAFVFYLTGECHYTYEYTHFAARAGSFLYLPKGQEYFIDRIAEGSTCLLINFQADVEDRREAFVMEPLEPERYEAAFQAAIRASLRDENNRDALVFSSLYQLIAMAEETRPPRLRGARARVQKASEEIQRRYAETDLSCAALAQACGMSEKYFQQLFREAYHLSPGEQIRLLRMKKARELLEATTLPISRVAEASGFSNQFYFARYFKEQTGMTPTQYRRYTRTT